MSNQVINGGSEPTAIDGLRVVNQKIAEWQALRYELRMIEETEHPPFTDRHGREWTWVSGDLWHHDDTLAYPRDMIDGLGLPREKLRDNPNYWRLCDVCRSRGSNTSPISPRCRVGDRWYDVSDGKFYE